MIRDIIVRYGTLIIAGCLIAIVLLLAREKAISNATAGVISLVILSIAFIAWPLLIFRGLNKGVEELSRAEKSSPFDAALKIAGVAFVIAITRWAFYHRDVSYLIVVAIVFVILLVGIFIRNYR